MTPLCARVRSSIVYICRGHFSDTVFIVILLVEMYNTEREFCTKKLVTLGNTLLVWIFLNADKRNMDFVSLIIAVFHLSKNEAH